jgi:hypothetical protein
MTKAKSQEEPTKVPINAVLWTWQKCPPGDRRLVRVDVVDGVVVAMHNFEEDTARITMAKLVLKVEENPLVV